LYNYIYIYNTKFTSGADISGMIILIEILNKYSVSFGWSLFDHDRNKMRAVVNMEMKLFHSRRVLID